MTSFITKATEYYDDLLKSADPRVADWFMMATPWPALFLCVFYVSSVKFGIGIMTKRKPFEIRKILVVYNIFMMFLSGYVFVEFLLSGWLTGTYSLGCQPVDYSYTPQAIRMAKVSWLFFFSKFIEFFDTLFFILRKKFGHISFLHVFHHGALPFMWWFGVKFVPGGFGTFHAMINSFIHLIMYTYYGLAAMGPKFQKYLWWKKYLTTLQLIQFIAMLVHSIQLLFIECNYPVIFAKAITANALMMLVLFGDFYWKEYFKKKPTVDVSRMSNGSVKCNMQHNGSLPNKNGTAKSNGIKSD
ncbi:of very long chain fatty acids 7 [Octopus vulgaris]|uniref:Of very long chain fatty acids 7 n=2 Tax=Octopus TaxID=6643 RepID=A0AA36B215_OCTVU|nr:elongation of very long chain fatty acids protein 7 [Octopus sinensis]CAI9725162.1 of very long chain fatty acids 7 [Octopus vulgaris]